MYFTIIILGILTVIGIFDQLEKESVDRELNYMKILKNARVSVDYTDADGQARSSEYILDKAEKTFGRAHGKSKADIKIPTCDTRMSKNAIRLIYDGKTFCIKRQNQKTVWVFGTDKKLYVLCSRQTSEEDLQKQYRSLPFSANGYCRMSSDISLQSGDIFVLGNTAFTYLREDS